MNLLVIMSHELSDIQINEAKEKLKVDHIKVLPQELKSKWSNISPKCELPINEIDKIKDWIKRESGKNDYILVQGEFGATFYIVDFCFQTDRIPIYATTKRVIEEKKAGDQVIVKRVFKHQNFRKYIRYDKKTK